MTTRVYAVPRKADGSWDFDAATEIVPPVRFEVQAVGCESCKWWVGDGRALGNAYIGNGSYEEVRDATRECHGGPPSVFAAGATAWPRTNAWDFCAAYCRATKERE